MSEGESRSRFFTRAWSFGVLALMSPVLVPFVARLLQPGPKVGRVAYFAALGIAALVCLLGFIFAVLTQRETEKKTYRRRIAGLTGALSAIMLLFWLVSTMAVMALGPRWR